MNKKILLLNLALVAALFALTSSLVSLLTPYGAATSPDSLSYLDIASNISRGKGALATDFSLQNIDQDILQEQRLWPPLYPALLSVVVNNYADVVAAAKMSRVMFFISALLIYLILTSYARWYWALTSTAFFCFASPMLTIFTYAWSETLFIPLMLLSVFASIRYADAESDFSGGNQYWLLLLVSALIALAYTRYVGIIFFLLLPYVFFLRGGKPRKYFNLAWAVSIYGLFVGGLLLSNYLKTSAMGGGMRAESTKSLANNVIDAYLAFTTVFPSSPYIFVALLVLSCAAAWARKALFLKDENHERARLRKSAHILLFGLVLYVAVMIFLRSRSVFDDLDVRLLAPAFPLLWLLLWLVLFRIRAVNLRGALVYALSMFFVCSFALNGYLQLRESMESWKSRGTPFFLMRGGLVYNNFTNTRSGLQSREFFSRLLPTDAVLVMEKPLVFRFVLGKKIIQKPSKIDLAIIHKLNALRPGSLLILGKAEVDSLKPLCIDCMSGAIDFGEAFAIRLPIMTAPETVKSFTKKSS